MHFLADCILHEVQVSIPEESDLLKNYADGGKKLTRDLQHGVSKSGQA